MSTATSKTNPENPPAQHEPNTDPAASNPSAPATAEKGKDDQKAKQDDKSKKSAAAALVITSPAPRRRAGRSFGPEATTIPIAELTKDEIALIEGDPMLSVKRVAN